MARNGESERFLTQLWRSQNPTNKPGKSHTPYGYPMKSFLGQWPTGYDTGMTLATLLATLNECLDSLGDYYVCNQ